MSLKQKTNRQDLSANERLYSALLSVLNRAYPHRKDPEGDDPLRLIVAVSGGLDSMVLFHALNVLAKRSPRRFELVAVAHVDHAFRAESAEDARFVAAAANAHGVPFALQTLASLPKGANQEAWAREQRYLFFESERSSRSADFVCTAHHANDLCETFLFRLLSGRLANSAKTIAKVNFARRLLRPCLELKQQDLERYAASNGLVFREDSSNQDLRFTRNRIRRTTVPNLIAEYNPSFLRVIQETTERLNFDENYLWRQAEKAVNDLDTPVHAKILSLNDPAIRWRMLLILCRKQQGTDADTVGFRNYQRCCELLERNAENPSCYALGRGLFMKSDSGEIHFVREEKLGGENCVGRVYCPIPGTVNFQGSRFSISSLPRENADAPKDSSEADCAPICETVVLPLTLNELSLRTFSPGDRVRLANGSFRRLKRFFKEQRLPVAVRTSLPLVCAEDEIIWVPGVFLADKHAYLGAKIDSSMERLVRICFTHSPCISRVIQVLQPDSGGL